jgi:hypothetical protein
MSSKDIISLLEEQRMSMNEIKEQLHKKKYAKNVLKDLKPISLDEFIENLSMIPINLLLDVKLPEYYMKTIISNLEKYEMNNRPIVCTDIKNRKCHYFTNNQWKQNKEFIKLLKNKIFYMVMSEIIKQKEGKGCYTDDLLMCLSTLCDVFKYPNDKLFDKILSKLCDNINNSYNSDEDDDDDEDDD